MWCITRLGAVFFFMEVRRYSTYFKMQYSSFKWKYMHRLDPVLSRVAANFPVANQVRGGLNLNVSGSAWLNFSKYIRDIISDYSSLILLKLFFFYFGFGSSFGWTKFFFSCFNFVKSDVCETDSQEPNPQPDTVLQAKNN